MRHKFLALAAFVVVGPALADDRPVTRPGRDVAVEYQSNGTPPGPVASSAPSVNAVTMRFSSKSNRIRIDGPSGHGYAIVDTDAGRMIIVMTERQMYVEQQADPAMLGLFRSNNSAFKRTGSDVVAGISCTTYDATIDDHSGKVCLTNDGVLLRARSDGPDRHRELEAVKVTYAEQPAALFEPPPGFKKMDLPDMARRPIPGSAAPPTGH